MMSDRPSFFAELRQRHVVRAALIYAAAVWALAQGIAQLSPVFGLSAEVTFWFVIACVIGFPFWIAFAWFFRFTPHGIAREDDTAADAAVLRRTGHRLDYWVIGILVIAVVLLLTNQLVLKRGKTIHEFTATASSTTHVAARTAALPSAPTTVIPAKSVAVLPFENLSADKANAYFADGIQDLILTKLADVGDLKVIARTSTESYGSHPQNLTKVGQQLGVATILEGSVQKAGKQVLINVQLIDARTDSHIWAKSYTRTLTNIFGVEGEVAGKVATALSVTLSSAQSASLTAVPTTNQAAYNLFLRAEYQANKSNTKYGAASWKTAIPSYRQAVQADPQFALAYARLALAENSLANFGGGGMNVKKLNRQARADADRALQLAPNLAASHLAIGSCDYVGGDYSSALKAFSLALEIDPNNALALAARGSVEETQGRFDAALASLKKAFALNPRNSSLATRLGITAITMRRYGKAETWLQRALALDPDNERAKLFHAVAIAFGTGNLARTLQAVQGDAPRLKLSQVAILTDMHKYRDALAVLKSVPDTPDIFSPFVGGPKVLHEANIYRLMGDTAKARPLFVQALAITRKQLDNQRASNLANVWQNGASAEVGLGHTADGLKAIAKSLVIAKNDHFAHPQLMRQAAQLYAEAGRADLAVPLIAKVLATPNTGIAYSPVLLWTDSAWAPIRHDPGFQALLKQYAKDKPAVASTASKE